MNDEKQIREVYPFGIMLELSVKIETETPVKIGKLFRGKCFFIGCIQMADELVGKMANC